MQAYQEMYDRSLADDHAFWAEQARKFISWDRDFETVHEGSFADGDNAWFTEGRSNASYNCVDRHAKKKPNAAALIFEPDHPDQPGRTLTWKELQREVARLSWVLGPRYWDIIAKHRVTQLYSAPTVLRLLVRDRDEHVETQDLLSHLRVIGSVGEPLAANVWRWVHHVVGQGSLHVVDTFFQTETGSYLVAPLAGTTPSKPGCCTLPMFGVEPALLDPVTGVEITTPNTEGVLTIKRLIPSMSRTVWRDHTRFVNIYYNPCPGYYSIGDGAIRDEDDHCWIQGRVDDVINVAAHRLSTAEIEAALLEHAIMAEVAVVGVPGYLTGQAIAASVSLMEPLEALEATKVAKEQVNHSIGKFASPKFVVTVNDLPKIELARS